MVDDASISQREQQAIDAVSILSKKWVPVVLLTLHRHGPLGYNDLLELVPEISSKVLTDTLDVLQGEGLVNRTVLSESPLRVEYELTPAGEDTRDIFETLSTWADRHFNRPDYTVVIADGNRRLTAVYREWLPNRYTVVRAHAAEELDASVGETGDVLVIDVRLPGLDLAKFVSNVRSHCRIVLVVGDRPQPELMTVPCDEILRKPLVEECIVEVVDEQLARIDQSAAHRQCDSLIARRSLFESLYPRQQLEAEPAYCKLCTRLDELDVDR